MKLEYLKFITQKHLTVAERYEAGTDTKVFGEDDPLAGGGYDSMLVARPTIHELMCMNHDDIHAAGGCLSDGYMMESKPNPGFSGGTIEDMVKRRNGWPEGVKKMQEAISQILPDGMFSKRPRPHWDEDGYDCDAERFSDGHDKPFLNRELRRGTRNISIGVRYGENCTVNQNLLFLRGAATVAAIDTLEDMGYRCDLTAICCSQDTWKSPCPRLSVTLIEVKRACEPVDLDYLASTVASPLFFRGNMFAWWFAGPYKVNHGLGRSVDIPKCFYPDVMITNLPSNVDEAKALYNNILEAAYKKMSRKVLTSEQEVVS